MSLGQFISGRRKHLRMTQEELAKKLSVSKSAIAKWETDTGIPDRDNLQKLARSLSVKVDDLHRVIDGTRAEDVQIMPDITPDVISALESYGYRVIRPGKEGEMIWICA